MKRIINILLLLLLVQTFTFAQGVGVDSMLVKSVSVDSVTDNTIKDTIVLEYSKGYVRFETIRREGDKYFAVTSDNKDVEITSMINGKTRALVKDDNGHELVIDKDGNVMGVEEYKKCGGSAKLLSEHNAYRDSTMATSGNVKFSKVKDENYGFDEWRGADYDKDEYDNFNGYRPTYIGAQKQSNIKVAASQTKGIRFITERGVPIIAPNDTLQLTIGTTGKQAVYAYRDSTLVGKLCIQAYDTKEVKVHVVRVNNGKQLELNKIADEVNRIYGSAVVHYTFDELDPIKIEYANKKHFVHGGKGTFQNYNTDQKAAIKALPENADGNDYYLFFTECYNRLDTAGNKNPEAVNGYMPVGRHYGFIYNEYTNARTIAHELGHGTNSLHHTFSQESETFQTAEKTDNLMDYNGGEYLNHRQWQWAHEKHRNVLGFLDDEEESENVEKYVVDKFVVLLNKVYSHNNATCEDYYNKIKTDKVSKEFDLGFNSKRLEDAKNPQQEETETTAESTETVPEEGSDDSEDELSNVPDEDVKWLSEWAVRVLDATSIMKSIWEKIYDAKSNSKIQSLSIKCNRVYITKITYKRNNDEKQYNVAIYNMTSSETLSGLQKMSINNLSDLNNESIKRYMYIDKSQSKKYWLLSFVENGKKENGKLEPSLVIQISGSCTDTDISNILESLGILKQLKEEDLTTELRDICYSFNNKEYITPTDKVQMTKDKILKVKGSNLCIYDNNAKAEGNDINDALYTCIGSTGAMNWVEHFMTSDLDECPRIVRESDDNDYILEIVRAMKFAEQKGKKFSRKVDDKISKYGEIVLPNGETISDITLSINSKDLSFDINDDNIYESPEIREWTGKNNVMLGFGKKEGDKYPLEITCNWDCVKDLKKYLNGIILHEDPIQRALQVIGTYIGRSYMMETTSAMRTDTTEAALAQMDCTELVCRFLKEACGLDKVPYLTTSDFNDLVEGSNDFIQYVDGSKEDSHVDIQPGDIFLWRNIKGGHMGIVKEYKAEVIIIEAIGKSGSCERSKNEDKGSCVNCIRESKYSRLGPALKKHDGWQGYFRPKITYK